MTEATALALNAVVLAGFRVTLDTVTYDVVDVVADKLVVATGLVLGTDVVTLCIVNKVVVPVVVGVEIVGLDIVDVAWLVTLADVVLVVEVDLLA